MTARIIPFPARAEGSITDYRAEPAIVLVLPVIRIEGQDKPRNQRRGSLSNPITSFEGETVYRYPVDRPFLQPALDEFRDHLNKAICEAFSTLYPKPRA